MKCAQNEGKFRQFFNENSISGFYLSSKRPQLNVLTCKFHLYLMQKGLYFTQKKELPSKIICSLFYEQKMIIFSTLNNLECKIFHADMVCWDQILIFHLVQKPLCTKRAYNEDNKQKMSIGCVHRVAHLSSI